MTYVESMPIGVVVVRETVDHPWQDYEWRPVSVVPGAPPSGGWKEMRSGEGWTQYLAGTVSLELFRKETEAYKYNLEGREPVLYVVLHEDDDEESEYPYRVHLVTASPHEAQDYLDTGDGIVEPVAMPEEVAAWVRAFVAEHHVEEKFKKRKRDDVDLEEHKFGQEPIFVTRKRMERQESDG